MKSRILGFLEIGATDGGPATISTFSIDVKNASPIVHLDTLLHAAELDVVSPNHDLLAIHEDGEISCYNIKLGKLNWSHRLETENPKLEPQQAVHLNYAAIINLQEARTSLLKYREDILAALDAASDNAESSLLVSLTSTRSAEKRNENQISFQVYHIRSATPGHGELRPHRTLRLLLSHTLPTPDEFLSRVSKFTIHQPSGLLYQQSPGELIIYDLSGPAPRVIQSLKSGQDPVTSCLRVSSSLLATSTPSSISVIDLPYCSLQGNWTFPNDLKNPSTVTKTNFCEHQPPNANSRLLSYFAGLNVIVALHGRRLIATPISIPSSEQLSRKRKRSGLLLNSLACGSSVYPIAPRCSVAKRSKKGFGPDQIKHHHRGASSAEERGPKRLVEQRDLTAPEDINVKNLEILNTQGSYVDHHRVSYALSKIFQVAKIEQPGRENRGSNNKLDIITWPAKACNWLIRKGLLTLDRITSSLRHYNILNPGTKLIPGALINALVQWDPSLNIVLTILESPAPISPVELASALLAVLQRFRVDEHGKGAKLLTNGEPESNTQIEGKNQVVDRGGLQEDISLAHRSADVNKEVLYLILQRLQSSSSDNIRQALKQIFARPQLRSLIDVLRMEIARDGWLTPYEDEIDDPESSTSPNSRITSIAHVINSILDTLGPTGWILGSSIADDFTETAETVSYMKAEISAALEGVEEAIYLKGILGEMLLCGKDSLRAPSKKALKSTKIDPIAKSQHVKPTTAVLRNEDSSVLPLGLKLKHVISTIKVGAGGEVMARSKRDIGRLKSKMVGKYSFERIVV